MIAGKTYSKTKVAKLSKATEAFSKPCDDAASTETDLTLTHGDDDGVSKTHGSAV